jgi:methionyl-tRNA synthetase
MSKRTLVTSALPYANGPLHLGHLAGAYLPADLYVRYKRLTRADIVFICGSDEHGVPITIAADKAGVSPQDIVDKNHAIIKETFEKMGISFDYYGRTSSKTHHETSQDFFKVIHDKGMFKRKTESQLFDPEAQKFLADRYVKGTCPICANPDAYGDQCEKCGSSLSPSELINPRSALTGATPEYRETEHWYIPLGDLQPQLEAWLATKTDWKPNVMGQVKSWLTAGLGDRAVTRDLNWGVKVPLPDAEGKVLYVWFDAPIGYISATKEWAVQQGDPELWKSYWRDEESDLIHFIGKDNIVFHCLMFPATLMAYGGYVLPKNVPANEFLNLEGQKLSTSRNWAVWIHEYLEVFPADWLRYAIATTLPETKDSDFSWKEFQNRVNGELADILGNFIFRTMSFTQRFFEGVVPEPKDLSEVDRAMLAQIATHKALIGQHYEAFTFREAVSATMNLARLGNKYFTDTEPWKTRKTDPQACANALYVSAQVSAALSVLFDPILPHSMMQLRSDLGVSQTSTWADVTDSMIPAGARISAEAILFPKVEDDLIQAQIDKLGAPAQAVVEGPPYAAPKDEIVYEDFAKLDLRVGTVLSAEPVPKSDKLLCLQVDLGYEQRQILSGIAKHVSPEDITGKNVVVVANLKPRKMLGLESKGMILFAEDREGVLRSVTPDSENGSTVA